MNITNPAANPSRASKFDCSARGSAFYGGRVSLVFVHRHTDLPRRVNVMMTADEARELAAKLIRWADESAKVTA